MKKVMEVAGRQVKIKEFENLVGAIMATNKTSEVHAEAIIESAIKGCSHSLTYLHNSSIKAAQRGVEMSPLENIYYKKGATLKRAGMKLAAVVFVIGLAIPSIGVALHNEIIEEDRFEYVEVQAQPGDGWDALILRHNEGDINLLELRMWAEFKNGSSPKAGETVLIPVMNK